MRILSALAAIALVLVILWCGFNFALWGRLTGRPTVKDFEAIAREGQPIAQAINDYRTDHGLLPETLNDVVPAYLPQIPKGWSYNGNYSYLGHRSGLPRTDVAYRFDGSSSQWLLNGEYAYGQILSIAGPIDKKSSIPASTLFATQLAEFEKRIRANPRDFYSYRDKIDFAALSKSNDVAIAECERASKLFPDWWLPKMALAELRTNDTQAEQNFKSWVEARPTFINYWYLSRFYRDKEDNDAAFAALDQAAENTFISQATEVEEMRRQLRLAVQRKPTKPVSDTPDDAYLIPEGFALDAARFCCENRRYELALKIIQHCEPVEGSWDGEWEIENRGFQAMAELGLGQFVAAIPHAQKAAGLGEPQSNWARQLPRFLETANAHNTNFWYQAEDRGISDWALFQKTEGLSVSNDDSAENAIRRAFQNRQKGDLDAAIADCTKAIQLQPLFAMAYNLRGWIEFLKKDFDASVDDATHAIRLNLNYGNAYGTRGWARYGKGDSTGAREDLKTAVELSGVNSSEVSEDQGLIEFINGRYQNAIDYWQKAIQEDSSTQRHLQPWMEKARQHAGR